MISTKRMKKVREYDYYGVVEAAYKKGKYCYMSIIDHRVSDTRLTGVYDELGVKRVSPEYIDKWLSCRFN